jgi:host factor-I protein
MEAVKQAIEPQFLSLAQTLGVKLRIGQLNRTEHEGIVKDIGRYEITIEEKGRMVTILKQDISCLTAPDPLLTAPSPATPSDRAPQPSAPADGAPGKPNIQQEFLDKAVKDNHPLTVFLITGQRIRAVIEAYDNFTLLLREGGRQHLFYKHAVTTINR